MQSLRERKMRQVNWLVFFAFFIFFIYSDVVFFTKCAREYTEYLHSKNKTFHTRYSVKLRMLPSQDLYLYLPVCNWAEKVLGLSQIPGMSPNLVSITHLCLAILSGRLLASHDLFYRRIAAFMFEFRTFLDVLDGVIYRAQTTNKMFISGWGSLGYLIDVTSDTLGSLVIFFGTIYRFNQLPPLKESSKATKYNEKKVDAISLLPAAHQTGSPGMINFKIVMNFFAYQLSLPPFLFSFA